MDKKSETRARGRPLNSEIRNNIIDMLFIVKQGYGYEIAKLYNQIFPKVTQRAIYYNLKKGESTNEFKVIKIRETKGNYSWGSKADRKYYVLGENARPNPNKELIKKIKRFKKL